MKNRITQLFNIDYPIIQAGMIWCSGWELASAVSNAGGLGIIGSGSMYPDVLDLHIKKCKANTSKPFAVNLPMLYPNIEEHIQTIIKHKVPIVFTSAGNPKTYTSRLQKEGVLVVHVVSSLKFAKKAQEAGVDAIVAEGFEAGGHNGRDETTTLCLIPTVRKEITIPLIAAGGIATGHAIAACMALGAEGFQIGSRFVACIESSAHDNFKNAVLKAKEGDTELTLKELTPVRLLKNSLYDSVKEAYANNASKEDLHDLLGRGRAKKGMFEGNLIEGELEIGQVAGILDHLMSAEEIIKSLILEFNDAKNKIINTSLKPND